MLIPLPTSEPRSNNSPVRGDKPNLSKAIVIAPTWINTTRKRPAANSNSKYRTVSGILCWWSRCTAWILFRSSRSRPVNDWKFRVIAMSRLRLETAILAGPSTHHLTVSLSGWQRLQLYRCPSSHRPRKPPVTVRTWHMNQFNAVSFHSDHDRCSRTTWAGCCTRFLSICSVTRSMTSLLRLSRSNPRKDGGAINTTRSKAFSFRAASSR